MTSLIALVAELYLVSPLTHLFGRGLEDLVVVASWRAQQRSVREVAGSAGMYAGQLSKVERGEKGLSVESMYRLAGALGLEELVSLLERCVGPQRVNPVRGDSE